MDVHKNADSMSYLESQGLLGLGYGRKKKPMLVIGTGFIMK